MSRRTRGERSAERSSRVTWRSELRLPLLHPVALIAVAVLVANDHLLKALAPGVATGKASDIAGLVFFPVLIVSAIQLLYGGRSGSTIPAAIAVTGLGFVGIKVSHEVNTLANVVLGVLQWVATAGPIRHFPPAPTTMVVDPTDLIALPALTLAWWITRRRDSGTGQRSPTASSRSGRRRRSASVMALVAASLATLGTSPAMERSTLSHSEEISLDRTAPALTRFFSYDVVNRDPDLTEVAITASFDMPEPEGADAIGPVPGIDVTIELDPPRPELGAAMPSLFGGSTVALTEACRLACQGGFWVVVRLRDDAPVADVTGRLDVGLLATGGEGESEVDIDLSLDASPERSFRGIPATARGEVVGQLRVGVDQPEATRQLEVVIRADALDGPLRYPLVGRIRASTRTTDASHHPNAHVTELWVEDEWVRVADEEEKSDFDFLPRCRTGQDCRLRLEIHSGYEAEMNDEDPGSADQGFVALEWSVEVQMEAFDGRRLPADAISVRLTGSE